MSIFRIIPFALCLATPATAQEAFTWVYNAHSPFGGGAPELDLVATQSFSAGEAEAAGERIPRGLIWATCVGGGMAQIRFEAFAGAAQAGDIVAFQMTDDAGTVLTLSAEIFNAGGEPVGGPQIVVQANGPELSLLATAPVVRYGVVGLTDFNIPFDLTANQAYVSAFSTACASGGAGGPGLPAPGSVSFEPDLGPDITGHVWARSTFVDEGNPEGSRVSMGYGVPETDDIVISGECVFDRENPFVRLQVTADVAGLQNGDPAQLRVSIPDGRSVILDGTVVGVDAEFGIGGIEFLSEVSDPAWLVIAGDRTVRFDRPDTGAGLTITGNGPNTIGPFLADCAEIAQLTPESGGRPSPPIEAPAGYLACDNFGRVSSRETGTEQIVNFINATDSLRVLTWIDPDANVVDVTSLDPGQAAAYTTDPGHIWMATDGPGNCLEMMQVPPGVTDYPITAVSQ